MKYLGALTDGKAGVLAWFIAPVIIDLPLSLVADTVVLPYTAFKGLAAQ